MSLETTSRQARVRTLYKAAREAVRNARAYFESARRSALRGNGAAAWMWMEYAAAWAWLYRVRLEAARATTATLRTSRRLSNALLRAADVERLAPLLVTTKPVGTR
jgi:hypothetical protein